MRFASGLAITRSSLVTGFATGAATTIAGAGATAATGAGAAAGAGVAASSSPAMVAITVPTLTPSLPSAMSIDTITPSSTASNSIVALSVSISARISPDDTVSPALTSHLASVPSSIVGESAGILMAIGMAGCSVLVSKFAVMAVDLNKYNRIGKFAVFRLNTISPRDRPGSRGKAHLSHTNYGADAKSVGSWHATVTAAFRYPWQLRRACRAGRSGAPLCHRGRSGTW